MTTTTCPMCKYYTVPGWIINAWQIIPCFKCNTGNKQQLPKPHNLAETAEGQANHEARMRNALVALLENGHISDEAWND